MKVRAELGPEGEILGSDTQNPLLEGLLHSLSEHTGEGALDTGGGCWAGSRRGMT